MAGGDSLTRLPGAARAWHRRLLALAVPIMLANLTQPALSAVDTAIAGHLPGPAPLGGVALGGLFFNFVFWGFGFLRMGTTGFVAQAYGIGDTAEIRATLARALRLALVIGVVLLAAQGALIEAALSLLGGSRDVSANAALYSHARIWSAPAALANYVVLGTLLGHQRPRSALLLQILINAANVAAAVLYVYGFGAGIGGLGAATATADWIGLFAGLVVLARARVLAGPGVSSRRIWDRGALIRLLAVNRDIFIRTLCLIGSFAWFAHQGAAEGDRVLAANAVLLNFQTFMAFALDGFANAAEALVGATVGSADRDGFRMAVRVTLFWSLAGAALFSAAYLLAGRSVIALLTDDPGVRATAALYMPWAAVSPLVSCWCFAYDGIYIGATRTRQLRDGMGLALASFLLASFALQPRFGNHGLWAALLLFMAVRGGVLAYWLGGIEQRIAAPAERRA